MSTFKINIFKTSLEDDVVFEINSSVVSSGTGTLDISGGQPLEVIGLDFVVSQEVGVFVSLEFTAPVAVGSLEPIHLTRSGTMTLDGSGNGTSTYLFDPTSGTSTCLITVTTRSSGLTDGIGDNTNIM